MERRAGKFAISRLSFRTTPGPFVRRGKRRMTEVGSKVASSTGESR